MSKQMFVFTGYNLEQAEYNRVNREGPYKLLISAYGSSFLPKEQILSFHIKLEFFFEGANKASFDFKAIFKILDENILNQLKEKGTNPESVFTPVVFPFIRSQIRSFSDDSFGSINLPIIVLQGKDITKGIQIEM